MSLMAVKAFLDLKITPERTLALALVADGREVEAAGAGETVDVLFDQSPFYAESGGQAGDTGELDWPGGRGRVLDAQKQAGDLLLVSIPEFLGGHEPIAAAPGFGQHVLPGGILWGQAAAGEPKRADGY
jgi:alanyl-tRNA synthetase